MTNKNKTDYNIHVAESYFPNRKKDDGFIGKDISSKVNPLDISKEIGILKKIGIGSLIALGLTLGIQEYSKVENPANMIMNSESLYNPVKDGKLWRAYMNEQEINGFYHNQNSWAAYQEKTKELNNGSLKNVEYTPDANHNGKTN